MGKQWLSCFFRLFAFCFLFFEFIFWDSKITADDDCSYEIKRCLLLGRKAKTNLDSTLKSRDSVNKGTYSQSYGFSSSQVRMWELDYKEIWAPQNWCFWTVVLEKALESPLDSKEIKPVNRKVYVGKTDAEAETPILWPPDVKGWFIGKGPDAGKDWGHEEKGTTEDVMVGWHHWLNGQEFEQTPGDSERSLVCYSSLAKSWTQLRDWKATTTKSDTVNTFN